MAGEDGSGLWLRRQARVAAVAAVGKGRGRQGRRRRQAWEVAAAVGDDSAGEGGSDDSEVCADDFSPVPVVLHHG